METTKITIKTTKKFVLVHYFSGDTHLKSFKYRKGSQDLKEFELMLSCFLKDKKFTVKKD